MLTSHTAAHNSAVCTAQDACQGWRLRRRKNHCKPTTTAASNSPQARAARLPKACAFYEGTLGLTAQFRDDAHGYAAFDAGPVRLGLACVGEDQPELVGRHTGIGFDVDDLEAEYTRLKAAGVAFPTPPERQPWGGFMALMEDPDGNVFYLDQISAAHG